MIENWLSKFELLDIVLIGCFAIINSLVARFGMWPYCLVALPGTAMHEACHWLLAKLFFSSPTFPNIWPKRSGHFWVMGSVSFEPTFLNRFPVAMAPLLLIPITGWFVMQIMHQQNGMQYATSGWIAGSLLHGSLPSSQDFKVAAPAILVLMIIVAAYFAVMY